MWSFSAITSVNLVASSQPFPKPKRPYSLRPIVYTLPSSSNAMVWCWAELITFHLCWENSFDSLGKNWGRSDFKPRKTNYSQLHWKCKKVKILSHLIENSCLTQKRIYHSCPLLCKMYRKYLPKRHQNVILSLVLN